MISVNSGYSGLRGDVTSGRVEIGQRTFVTMR